MRKSMDIRKYNQTLFVILVAVTVIICVAALLVAVMLSKDEDSSADKNKVTEVLPENEISEEIVKENPEETPDETPDETEIVPDEITEQTDTPEISEPEIVVNPENDWMLILANPWNKLPEDFTVELSDIGNGYMVDSRIVGDLNAMMSDLRGAGLSAFVCSAYRTNAKQTTLYNNEVADYRNRGYSDEDAAIEAAKWVAIPGTSEHQTGLAVDIMSNYYLILDEGQENTAEQQWLMANSYKYGFILRYPNNKSEITGIYYEPWHYRYVGVEAATEMYEKGICFEEYLLG